MSINSNRRKIFHKSIYLFIIFFLCVIVTGCTKIDNLRPVKSYSGLRDAQGEKFALDYKPKRIVSLTVRSDEILLELVGTERIIALSPNADEPLISNVVEMAKKVTMRASVNQEHLISLNPDLIVISESQPYEVIYSLREIGIPVYVCRLPKTIQDTEDLILDLGNVVGETEKSIRMVEKMENELRRIKEAVDKIPEEKRVVAHRFTVSGGNGGKNSYYNDICKHAGVKNGAAMMNLLGSQLMTKEQIILLNPDILFLPDWDYAGELDIAKYKNEILNDPALQNIKAIKEKRLYVIPDRHMLSSSQYMIECVKDIYNVSYNYGE